MTRTLKFSIVMSLIWMLVSIVVILEINGVRVFDYTEEAFTSEQIDQLSGITLLEFGALGVDTVRLQVLR